MPDIRTGLPQRSTRRAKSRPNSPSGSAVRPVCTGPAWTIVLAGATSQWKRSEAGSSAIGPPCGSPAAISSIVESSLATASKSQSGASAFSSTESSCVRAPRKRSGRQKSTTPALTASPRSTRGTIRSAAYWNGLRVPLTGRLQPLEEELGVERAVRPLGRDERGGGRGVGAVREPGVRVGDRARGGQQHVVADRRKRVARSRQRVGPVEGVERRAVVDQPEVLVPAQQVGIARRAIDV